MSKQDDGLFLLEALIDKIVFVKSPCFSDRDFRTCVNIECQAIEPLEICDDDPQACAVKSGGPFIKTFNNGKSCLFSLKESEISSAMSKFLIKVSVYKTLPCGCLPTKIVMGEANIDMTKEFVEARKNFLADPTTVSYQALKDSFRITGPDGTETGEIMMFLRISCFGKLIITRFQGGGPPSLGANAGNAIVNRSCNPPKEFQTIQDPCACGAAHGSGGTGGMSGKGAASSLGGGRGACTPARDPYNTMPCIDPDDPCYCTGPKPSSKQQMACRNTDQYCLHVPKDIVLGEMEDMAPKQEMAEEQKLSTMAFYIQMEQIDSDNYSDSYYNDNYKLKDSELNNNVNLPTSSMAFDKSSSTSCNTLKYKKRSVSFSNAINYVSKSHQSVDSAFHNKSAHSSHIAVQNMFGDQNTAVYMTLYDEVHCNALKNISATGTQATASINKCLQVQCQSKTNSHIPSLIDSNSQCYSSYTTSTFPCSEDKTIERIRYSDVYFFGRKKATNPEKTGMGNSGTSNNLHRTGQTPTMPINIESRTAQTRKVCGATTGTCTKSVSIRENKPCDERTCPAIGNSMKGEMIATVSHIKLGPREPCPVHGKEPCQGPNCILTSSGEEQAPVKVTTMTNPRRGVFELVIRRMTGAPLAKNELMLEWTPPPSRPLPCGHPCSIPCSSPVPSRLSKCKMIVCRPSSCKPKGCRKLCDPPPCRSVPCRLCGKKSCSGKPCRFTKPCRPRRLCKPCPPPRCKPCEPCRPCPPPRRVFKRPSCKPCKPCSLSPCSQCVSCSPYRPSLPCKCRKCRQCAASCKQGRQCKPCPPLPCSHCAPCRPCKPCPPCSPSLCSPSPCRSPCRKPCCEIQCSKPCKSSPSLRPCKVRRKKVRKCKSLPKIRAHRRRISPCLNRSKCCPVVRCRSVSSPCLGYSPPCPPRKCSSTTPFKTPLCSKSYLS